jgi:FAD/FMN-containing dehydrogenase
MKITNAGNYPIVDTTVVSVKSSNAVHLVLQNADNCIVRGMGNGIGDSAMNQNLVLSALGLDKIISFDQTTGVLVAQSGVTLEDISNAFIPLGWFLATVPGTSKVSLGGAVAADVHGKNHHVAGSFSNHVLWFQMVTADGELSYCSPTSNPDLFHATCGGFGLTGVLVVIAVQMVRIPSGWIKQKGVKTKNLLETLDACERYGSATYTVAWVDPHAAGKSMGRGYLMCGEFAAVDELSDSQILSRPRDGTRNKNTIPLYFPVAMMSFRGFTEAINLMYKLKTPAGFSHSIVDFQSFFYPLQAASLKMVGGGHITYQFVLPYSSARDGLVSIYKKIVDSGLGSLISVLKLFGEQKRSYGNISYPMSGYNLGIDFRVSPSMFRLFRELDAMVHDYGGRHYLAKDVCLTPEGVRRGYGNSLDEFLEVKAKWDPQNRFRSLQSMRLKLY